MNTHTMEKLQGIELKEQVKEYCVSGLGKELLERLQPSSNMKVVRNRLQETSEGRKLLDAENYVPLVGISDIGRIIDQLEKGIVLEPGEFIAVSDFLRGCRKTKGFMEKQEWIAPMLSSYANSMTVLEDIEEEINFTIKNNQVDSEASKELKRIRKHIAITEEKIEDRLTKFLRSSSNKECIQEFYITKKDGRFTIPVKASYKNRVAGTVIEISSKGSTVFIEPDVISKLSVELITLQSEEAMEVYQILATLAGMVMEQIRTIKINMELIGQYDLIFAKAKHSKAIEGIEPKINQHGYIAIRQGKHPLLKGTVVPLDVQIGKDYRSLIITGPNAGGKTIVLKTIGLLTVATELGLHIPAQEGTEISIFEHIFVDIGDNQSLENALSTFSSHMKNIADILSRANKNTLLLFDEIGSGTEPNEGAALAIAILEEFYHMGCITVATTHYGEIKSFSEMHDDFMNAAMQFRPDTLEPLYKLLIGQSGDSNALWIAKKMQLKERVLSRARGYMENKEYNLALVNDSKVMKPIIEEQEQLTYDYQVGDRVKLLELDDVALIYRGMDEYNNVQVFYQGVVQDVHYKRVQLELSAEELYPAGYDLDTLFTSFEERKWQHDMERGSKKALKKVEKDRKKQQLTDGQ